MNRREELQRMREQISRALAEIAEAGERLDDLLDNAGQVLPDYDTDYEVDGWFTRSAPAAAKKKTNQKTSSRG